MGPESDRVGQEGGGIQVGMNPRDDRGVHRHSYATGPRIREAWTDPGGEVRRDTVDGSGSGSPSSYWTLTKSLADVAASVAEVPA